MLHFFTFCVHIGIYSKPELEKCINLLHVSLEKNIKCDWMLHIYTNFDLNISQHNTTIKKYYDNNRNQLYGDKWLNLSYNKINIYKDLSNELACDPIWIDIDTVVTGDLSYLQNVNNFFIDIGGTATRNNKLLSNSDVYVPRSKYIQGNFWKVNLDICELVYKYTAKFKSENTIPNYDLQDIFSYFIVFEDNCDKYNILGRNVMCDRIYGLSVWDKGGDTHATQNGLMELQRRDNILFTNIYPDKRVDLLSFTFRTIRTLWNNPHFMTLI